MKQQNWERAERLLEGIGNELDILEEEITPRTKEASTFKSIVSNLRRCVDSLYGVCENDEVKQRQGFGHEEYHEALEDAFHGVPGRTSMADLSDFEDMLDKWVEEHGYHRHGFSETVDGYFF